jgi:hypothetical protein
MAQVNQSTQNVNVPVILTAAGTAIAANPARVAWSIQNLGTNPLFVLRGTGASITVFHTVLKGGTGNDDGTGGSISEEAGTIYNGILTVAGSSPRFVITEIAP